MAPMEPKGQSQLSGALPRGPTIYVIDKDGVIRFKNVRGRLLDEAIETLLGEMGEKVKLVHPDEDEH